MLKSIFGSKTIWGALIALISTVLSGAGIDIGTDSLQKAFDLIVQLGQILGPILAIVGRITAKGPLVPSPAIAPPG